MGRDISVCHPRLQELCTKLIRECAKQGLSISIGECFRTVAEQDKLYAQGRTTPGRIVTNAKGSSYSSQHQWGIAFDFYRSDGKGTYCNDDNFFQKVGSIAKSVGLGWGGDWRNLADTPHVYLPDWGSGTKQLKDKYSTFEKFKATWQSIGGINVSMLPTVKLGVKGKYVEALQILLTGKGYACGAIDGACGNKTMLAIQKFQAANSLVADGVCGSKTWTVLLGVQ